MKALRIILIIGLSCAISGSIYYLLFTGSDTAPKEKAKDFSMSSLLYKQIVREADSIDCLMVDPIVDHYCSKTLKEDQLQGHVKYVFEREYDLSEMQTEFAKKRPGKVTSTTYTEYNAQGHKVSSSRYGADNKPIETETFTYDNSGNCIQQAITDNVNNCLAYYINYQYRNNLRTEESVIYSQPENSFTRRILYDSLETRPLEICSYNHQGELFHRTVQVFDTINYNLLTQVYEYNKKGLMEKHLFYRYNMLNYMRTVRIFNSRNNIENSLGYKYAYDKQNNWVTKVEYHYGTPSRIFKREICYFE